MNADKDIRLYQTSSGKRPFDDWLMNLRDGKARNIISQRIDRLERGLAGPCESVGGHVYELKIYYGPGYRIYFAYDGAVIILLLLGGDKSSQSSDISKAKEYWKDYQRRKS